MSDVVVKFGQGGQYLGTEGSAVRRVKMKYEDYERMCQEVPRKMRNIGCALRYGGELIDGK